MFGVIVSSCILSLSLGLLVRDQHAHPNLPGFCNNLDCPRFSVLQTFKAGYELRQYEASKWVMTNLTTMVFTDADDKAMFDKLFYYISGNNSIHSKIPMTAPVLREVFHGPGPTCESTFMTHFMIPFSLQSNTPAPTDPHVYIRDLPVMKVFVRTFGGRPAAEDYMNELQTLADQIGTSARYESAYYFFAGYDSPYKVSNRHNEVWLKAL
ncbi:heme-binding protein 2-like [Ostrea edulis]|uniref:heme-binding protein 2-like n=1 Tax=Ostrea edulis TaxID=37623 RepID=UPI0024AFDCF9|nr:heme-binding protein 2-like [Ostrea edulis]XP_048733057.2 heme-binding protein 2-like [Ostrea edulis]